MTHTTPSKVPFNDNQCAGVLQGVVLSKNKGGKKESNRLENFPVSEDEHVTCWFEVGSLDLKMMDIRLSKFELNSRWLESI